MVAIFNARKRFFFGFLLIPQVLNKKLGRIYRTINSADSKVG